MKQAALFVILIFLLSACDKTLLGDEKNSTGAEENLKVPDALADGIEVSSFTRVNMDSTRIYSFVKELRENGSNNIRSILIARNNKLVLESYFNGWNRERKQDLRSATKSFTSALMGIAIDKKIVGGVNEPVFSFFTAYESFEHWEQTKGQITIGDFLRMRTGLSCNNWIPSSPGNEENMYKTEDWVKFILDLPIVGPSGQTYAYCIGAPVTLGAIISHAPGKPIPEFAKETLFDPLGITDYNWEFMPNGSTDTSGHLHLRPRDMLKFGLLFLNGGNWKGEQIISSAWINESTRADGDIPDFSQLQLQYGYLWWCKSWLVNNKTVNAYFANGNGGQVIFVLPALDLVVVFTGGAYNTNHTQRLLAIMESTILPAVVK